MLVAILGCERFFHCVEISCSLVIFIHGQSNFACGTSLYCRSHLAEKEDNSRPNIPASFRYRPLLKCVKAKGQSLGARGQNCIFLCSYKGKCKLLRQLRLSSFVLTQFEGGLFALVTRQPYCPGRPKKLCFTTLSLTPMVSTARLSVVKQSFFGLPGQYGRHVTRANW